MNEPTSRDLSTFPPGWQEDLKKVSEAIFGTWTPEKKRCPGVLERLQRIEWAGLVIGVLVAMRFLGVPTEQIFPLVSSFFGHGGGN